jgi:tRNA pseudouridine55 synthase
MNSGSHLTAFAEQKIGDYNVIDATDVTLFEDQLNSYEL